MTNRQCEPTGMDRRTFLKATAASLTVWPFLAAHGQQTPSAEPTTVFLCNDSVGDLNKYQFDPLDPSHAPGDLHSFGLPYADPRSPLYPMWERVFKLPLAYKNQSSGQNQILEVGITPIVGSGQAPIGTTRWETSQNWSGAYVEPRNGNMFTEVAGAWTIPEVTNDDDQSYPTVKYSSSIWVGLDGQRDYFNSSLPQLGTTQGQPDDDDPRDSSKEYQAWYQWWLPETRGKPNLIHDINCTTLTPGDEVFCVVQVIDLTSVIMFFALLRDPIIVWSKRIRAPMNRCKQTPRISGATAQWIVERPTDVRQPKTKQTPGARPVEHSPRDACPPLPAPLPFMGLVNFNQVEFTNCWATSAPAPGADPPKYHNLSRARYIRMYKRDDLPARTVRLSTPSLPSPDQESALTVKYVAPT